MDRNPSTFLQHELARLRDENSEMREEVTSLRAFVSTLAKLFEVVFEFESDEQLMPLLHNMLVEIMKLLNAPDGSLLLLDEETNQLAFVICIGALADKLVNTRIPADEGISGWVVKNGKPTLVRNTRTDQRFSDRIDTNFTFRTQSIAAAPLIGNRKVYGVVEVLNQPGDEPFSDFELSLLHLVCRAAGEVLADIASIQPGKGG